LRWFDALIVVVLERVIPIGNGVAITIAIVDGFVAILPLRIGEIAPQRFDELVVRSKSTRLAEN
jgi:hypothetical protein